jgi:hypothetical protein
VVVDLKEVVDLEDDLLGFVEDYYFVGFVDFEKDCFKFVEDLYFVVDLKEVVDLENLLSFVEDY